MQALWAIIQGILPTLALLGRVKQLYIKMYLNGMGLRGIERVSDIHHTMVMH